MKKYYLSSLLILGFALTGCEYVLPTQPILGYESNDQACSDGRDNDEDGLIDCEDADCVFGSSQCGEDVPLIPNVEPEQGIACHDQIDNDDNGQFDCGDPACNSVLENCCSKEFSNETCADGLDNDGNGYVDCEDFGCRNDSFGFVTVCDNFSSGGSNCVPTGAGTETTLAECSDGLDNDCNGYVDCEDFSCSRSTSPEVLEYCEVAAGDPEDTLETCQDGIDNDGNGYVDCNDFSCSQNLDAAIADLCVPDEPVIPEDTVEMCTDGLDNDGDGYIDCRDNSCRNNESLSVRRVCQESLPQSAVAGCDGSEPNNSACYDAVLAACSDGQDNDGDSYVDCEDFDCNHHPLRVCKGTKVCQDN